MLRQAPYLQRRGYNLAFRISVPPDLREIVGLSEITKALSTTRKSHAVPLALEFAACAKRLFYELRAIMTESDNKAATMPSHGKEKMLKLIQQAKHKLHISELKDQHCDELYEQRREHHRELQFAKLEARNEALMGVLAGLNAPSINASVVTLKMPVLMFKTVIDEFLSKYQRGKKPAMFKKHQPVLNMLLEVTGDKPVTELKQADINNFFELLGQLPPRWNDQCRKRKLTIRQLAALDHELTLGPKTFKETYIASVRPFIMAAKKDWQDQGFPLTLTTDGIEYFGDREEGEFKQRAFNLAELKRLFEGPEMRDFSSSSKQANCFWLPTLGLYTGARVNEICQLNPQTDIFQDDKCGTWFLWITKDTEGDPRIIKSVKTGDSRKVPIHSKLVELGFLDYVKRIKSSGAKLLFPEWQPINSRASGEAEKWFRQFLRDTKLRDETPKECILGMHAFRHTLLTYGAMEEPPLSLFCITGHAQEESPISATGAGKGYLTLSLLRPLHVRAALLNKLNYKLKFFKPK